MSGDVSALLERYSVSHRPTVRIEVPRWSLIKPRGNGSIDFISPFPSPYNYGCIPGVIAPDGDALDVVVLGPRLARGTELTVPIQAVIGFIDAGQPDPKVICSSAPLDGYQRHGLIRFFRFYAVCKTLLNTLRRLPGRTICTGWQRL